MKVLGCFTVYGRTPAWNTAGSKYSRTAHTDIMEVTMSVFCSHCGTKLEDFMKFCYACGNPPKDSSTTATKQRPRVEYKEIDLDLTKGGPPITYEPVMSNNLNFQFEQTKTWIMKQVRQ